MKRILSVSLALVLVLTLIASVVGCSQPAPSPSAATTPSTSSPAAASSPSASSPATPAPQAEQQTFKLKYTSSYPPPPYLDSTSEVRWMELVTERSNGRITFEQFYGGALGGANETFPLVRSGGADVGAVAYGNSPTEFPFYGWEFATPFGPTDPEITLKAARDLWAAFPQFEETLAKQGLHHLLIIPWDSYNILSLSPIQKVEDMKGMRMGVWGTIFPKWVEAVGASGVASASSDRYTMLQTGLLDASVLPVQTTESLKLYEVAKNFTFANLGPSLAHSNAFNLKTWNSLPPDLQQICTEAAKEVELEHAQKLLETRESARKILEDNGVNVYEFSFEEQQKWSNLIPDVGAEWAEALTQKGYPGYEIVQKWQELCEKYGWKWSREWAVKK